MLGIAPSPYVDRRGRSYIYRPFSILGCFWGRGSPPHPICSWQAVVQSHGEQAAGPSHRRGPQPQQVKQTWCSWSLGPHHKPCRGALTGGAPHIASSWEPGLSLAGPLPLPAHQRGRPRRYPLLSPAGEELQWVPKLKWLPAGISPSPAPRAQRTLRGRDRRHRLRSKALWGSGATCHPSRHRSSRSRREVRHAPPPSWLRIPGLQPAG